MTEITQADYDATEELWNEVDLCTCDRCHVFTAETFARHRMQERAAIVAWLHEKWVGDATDNIDVFDMIDGIKAGEHLK
jgi:hypothetical protein